MAHQIICCRALGRLKTILDQLHLEIDCLKGVAGEIPEISHPISNIILTPSGKVVPNSVNSKHLSPLNSQVRPNSRLQITIQTLSGDC